MHKQLIFNFKTDVSKVDIPLRLNNPFYVKIPEIVSIATKEFQDFIISESQDWEHDFLVQKGKMFGVLVVQKENGRYSFIGTVSGKLIGDSLCNKFIPSVFNDSAADFFINKGMAELTEIGNKIKQADNLSKIEELKEARRQKSFVLQQWLFDHYRFLNIFGEEKNVLEIFENSSHGNPPAAAGECAAPKLLHFAFKHKLKPIALAEFWWGNSPKNQERQHKAYYPACKNKCRPILEFMLNDNELFNISKTNHLI